MQSVAATAWRMFPSPCRRSAAASIPGVPLEQPQGSGSAQRPHHPNPDRHPPWHGLQGNDYALRYHDLNANRFLRYFRGHTGRVTTLSMSPKSDVFLSAAEDKQVGRQRQAQH